MSSRSRVVYFCGWGSLHCTQKWRRGLASQRNTKASSHDYIPVQCSGFKLWFYLQCVFCETSHGNSMSPPILDKRSLNPSARNACTALKPTTTSKRSRSTTSRTTGLGTAPPTPLINKMPLANIPQNGAIPKSHPQSPTGAAHAQTARIRVLPSRRVADTRVASIRHDARARAVRRDGQLAAGTVERGKKSVSVLSISLPSLPVIFHS